MSEIITIGSATQDIFISSKCSKIINVKGMFEEKELLCLGHGDKIEVENPMIDVGGGAINVAANFKNLGFEVAPIVKMGKDVTSHAILNRLEERGIDPSLIIRDSESNTGFSVILTSFEGDRTVLTHRGPNGKITKEDIPWDRIKEAKWLYIAPLSNESNLIVEKLVKFAKENNVKIAYNPGGTALKMGFEHLKESILCTDVLLMNKDEASKITDIDILPNRLSNESKIPKDTYKMIEKLSTLCSKVILITDGKNGAIAFDHKNFYKVGVFPAKPVTTLGAGDAFSSTFVAGLIKTDGDIEKSLKYAAINSASVIEQIGAQVGFKNFDDIEKSIKENPNFKVEIIKEI